MKVSFEPSWLQTWMLVGLSPWQAYLVHQQVDFIKTKLASKFTEGSESSHRPLLPRLPESIRWLNANDTSIADVVIVAAAFLQGEAKTTASLAEDLEPNIPLPRSEERVRNIRPTIRLLWDWSPSGTIAMRQLLADDALGISFHGVICDPVSLRSWIRVSLIQGASQQTVSHPILSRIAIPKLSPS